MLDEKDLQAIDELIARRLGVVVESDIMPKFDLLADGLASVNEKLNALPDPDLLDKMQEELDLHHQMLKRHTKEINALKKAQ